MAVWIAHQHRDERIRAPCIHHGSRPETQCCDAGERPDTLQDGDEGARVEILAETGYGEEEEDVADAVGDYEEVCCELVVLAVAFLDLGMRERGVYSVKPDTLENQSNVGVHRDHGYVNGQT